MAARMVGLALAALALASCQSGPVMVVHKTGSTFAERSRDYDQCRIDSLQVIPQVMATEYEAGYSEPAEIECTGRGKKRECEVIDGYTEPATFRTFDVNAELRDRYENRCLARKGYALVEKPVCTPAQKAKYTPIDPQPPAAEIPCMIVK